MDWDEPKPRPAATVGQDLKTLSVTELEARIKDFEAEIERHKAEIARKKSHSAAAESLFKR